MQRPGVIEWANDVVAAVHNDRRNILYFMAIFQYLIWRQETVVNHKVSFMTGKRPTGFVIRGGLYK